MHIVQQYKAYFRNIATQHKGIAHADQAGQVAFGIENLADIMDGAIRTAIGNNLYLFLLLNPIVRPKSNNNAFDATLQGGFVLLRGGISLRETAEADILSTYDAVNDTVIDILTRMVDDSRSGHTFWQHGLDVIQEGDVDIEELAFGSQKDGSFVGYKLIFSANISLLDCGDFSNRLTNSKWSDK